MRAVSKFTAGHGQPRPGEGQRRWNRSAIHGLRALTAGDAGRSAAPDDEEAQTAAGVSRTIPIPCAEVRGISAQLFLSRPEMSGLWFASSSKGCNADPKWTPLYTSHGSAPFFDLRTCKLLLGVRKEAVSLLGACLVFFTALADPAQQRRRYAFPPSSPSILTLIKKSR